mmetsp:Transcript_18455/g.55155  ORF Transcript_18455/g.55155 Transcript_18455/m.55155 type:complete len:270 (-) Transcript_18455:209-1018(-)
MSRDVAFTTSQGLPTQASEYGCSKPQPGRTFGFGLPQGRAGPKFVRHGFVATRALRQYGGRLPWVREQSTGQWKLPSGSRQTSPCQRSSCHSSSVAFVALSRHGDRRACETHGCPSARMHATRRPGSLGAATAAQSVGHDHTSGFFSCATTHASPREPRPATSAARPRHAAGRRHGRPSSTHNGPVALVAQPRGHCQAPFGPRQTSPWWAAPAWDSRANDEAQGAGSLCPRAAASTATHAASAVCIGLSVMHHLFSWAVLMRNQSQDFN